MTFEKNRFGIQMRPLLISLGILLVVSAGAREFSAFTLQPGLSRNPGLESNRDYRGIKDAEVAKTMNQSKFVVASIWGGNGIRVSVDQKKVSVEYACASGEIIGRLRMDKTGSFKANGFHIVQRPGPVRMNDTPQRQPARFEGKIRGKTMTISVILTETGENIGNFELKRDATVRLHRCL